MTKNKEVEITFDQLDEMDCVEVIRCENCCNGRAGSDGTILCELDDQLWQPDDYCGYGERT